METGTGLLDLLTPHNLLLILALAGVALGTNRLVEAFLDRLGRQNPRSRFALKRAASIIRFLVLMLALGLGLELVAPTREVKLATLTTFGLALGLGGQELVRNLVGGMVILFDKPFQLGDQVQIGEAQGEINHIGLLTTRLTTPDDTVVTLPNSLVASRDVWNSNSGVPDCLVVTSLYLPLSSNPRLLETIGWEAAWCSPYTLLSKPVTVLVTDHMSATPWTLLRIKAYVYEHRQTSAMMNDLTIRVKQELRRRGVLQEA
jgi:small-conductance mechanosensitive channel